MVCLPRISRNDPKPSRYFQFQHWIIDCISVTFRNPQDRFQEATRTTATITSHPRAHRCLPRVLSIHTPPVVSATNTSPEQSPCPCPRRRLSAAASYGETSVRHFPCGMPGVRFSHIFIDVRDVNSLNCSDVLELHWPILVLRLRVVKSNYIGLCKLCAKVDPKRTFIRYGNLTTSVRSSKSV